MMMDVFEDNIAAYIYITQRLFETYRSTEPNYN